MQDESASSPGIFYVCKACEQIHIPSDEVGKREKKENT